MKAFKTRALAFTGGAVVVVALVGCVAYSTIPSASSPASPADLVAATTATTTPAGANRPVLRNELRNLLRYSVHVELIVQSQKGFETIDADRGTVASISSSSISLTRPDGTTVSAVLTQATRFLGLKESQLAGGDQAIMVQTGGNAAAVFSRQPQATGS
jgi:hypothetical protein